MKNELSNLKLLLVDDDASYLNLLTIYLKKIGIENVAKATSYQGGLQYYSSFQPDICFLDIELKGGTKNGIDLAKVIRKGDSDIPIFFLTSHYEDDFYEQVRSIHPSGFMNKELCELKLRQAIELVLLQHRQLEQSLVFENSPTKTRGIREQMFFKIGDMYKAIKPEEIDYFFAENKFTYARVGARNFPTTVQLKTLGQELSPFFLRCHKKYLVNVNSIDSILTRDDKVKIGKELLPIGYTYRKSFLEQLNVLK